MKKNNLTDYEKETIITFNIGDYLANIYTRDPKFIRKMNSLVRKDFRVKRVGETEVSRTYELPKDGINIILPKKPKVRLAKELL